MQAGEREFHKRDGFTLFELVLVLAVLLVLLGFAAPNMLRVYSDLAVKEASQDMRREITHTRLLAIDYGRTYHFHYEPGGRKFVAIPAVLQIASAGNGMTTVATANENAAADPPLKRITGQLPEGLQFDAAVTLDGCGKTAAKVGMPGAPSTNTAATLRLGPQWFEGLDEASDFAGVTWSSPLVFYGDGSSSGGALAVSNPDRKHHITLSIRDLTGAVTLGDVKREGLR